MADQNVNVNFRGNDDISAKLAKLEKRFNALNKRLNETNKRARGVGDNFKKMKRDSDGLSRSLKRVGGLLAGAFAIRTVKSAVDLGVAVRDVRQQFDLLVRSNRGNPNIFLRELRRTAQGTVSDFALLQAAAQGLGRSLSLSEVNAAVGASLTIAAQQGKSAATALEEIISAVITLSAQRLDNIGITPAQLRGLDDAQKKLVVLNRLQQLALQQPSIEANQSYKTLNATIENLRNNLSAALVSSRAFYRITERLNKFFTAERVNKWAEAIERGIDALTKFAQQNPTLVKALAGGAAIQVATGGAAARGGVDIVNAISKTIGQVIGPAIGGFIGTGGVGRLVERFNVYRKLKAQTDIFGGPVPNGTGPITGYFDTNSLAKKSDRIYARTIGRFPRFNDVYGDAEGFKYLNKLKGFGQGLKSLGPVVTKISLILTVILAIVDFVRGFYNGLKSRGQSFADYLNAWKDIFGGFFDVWKIYVEKVVSAVSTVVDVVRDAISAVVPDVVKAQLRIVVDSFKQVFGNLLTGIKNVIVFITNIFKNLGEFASQFPFRLRDALSKVPGVGSFISDRVNARGTAAAQQGNAQFLKDANAAASAEFFAGIVNPTVNPVVPAPASSATGKRLRRILPRGRGFNAGFGPTFLTQQQIARNVNAQNTFGGFGGGLSGAILEQAFEAQRRFNEKVDNLAGSFTALQTITQELLTTLGAETIRLRDFGNALANSFKIQGGNLFSQGIGDATGGLRKSLAEGALKSLGGVGASLVTGGLFFGVGSLLGGLFGKKEQRERRVAADIELIARNTSRSNDLLNKIINAGSNFVYSPASQLAYAGISRAAFEDAGR